MERLISSRGEIHTIQYDDKFDWIFEEADRVWISSMGSYKRVYIRFREKIHLLHRLIWGLEHMIVPTRLNHISVDALDNRLDNLEPSNPKHDCIRKRVHVVDGHLPGTHQMKNGRWKACVYTYDGKNQKRSHLGIFDTQHLAHHAWLSKIADLGLYSQYFPGNP